MALAADYWGDFNCLRSSDSDHAVLEEKDVQEGLKW